MRAEEFIPKNDSGKYSRNEVVSLAESYAESKVRLEKSKFIDRINKHMDNGGDLITIGELICNEFNLWR